MAVSTEGLGRVETHAHAIAECALDRAVKAAEQYHGGAETTAAMVRGYMSIVAAVVTAAIRE